MGDGVDKIPAFFLGLHIALGHQLFIGVIHGAAADLEIGSKGTGRRQPAGMGKISCEYLILYIFIDLQIHGNISI